METGGHYYEAIDEQPDQDRGHAAAEAGHLQGARRRDRFEQVLLSLPWTWICGGIQGPFSSSPPFWATVVVRRAVELTMGVRAGPPEDIQVRWAAGCARLPRRALRTGVRPAVRKEDG